MSLLSTLRDTCARAERRHAPGRRLELEHSSSSGELLVNASVERIDREVGTAAARLLQEHRVVRLSVDEHDQVAHVRVMGWWRPSTSTVRHVTEFVFRYPRWSSSPNGSVSKPSQRESSVGRDDDEARELVGLRVLVVEDDADARELIVQLLQRHGAEVQGVDSAAAARDSLAESLPDLLLSDIGMAEEDGVSLVASLRASANADWRRLPAVALTAFTSEHERRRALQAGFSHHLRKPVRIEVLVETLLEAAGRERA